MENSILHCHCRGLHSIALYRKPSGQLVRMFVTDASHDMWMNYGQQFPFARPEKMSIGFHPHHCDIAFHGVCGTMINWVVTVDQEGENGFAMHEWMYTSPVNNMTGYFELSEEDVRLRTIATYPLNPMETVFMKAYELHTVAVERFKIAAWIVEEGKEDAAYMPVCYSNADLSDKTIFDGLYVKPTRKQIDDILATIGV